MVGKKATKDQIGMETTTPTQVLSPRTLTQCRPLVEESLGAVHDDYYGHSIGTGRVKVRKTTSEE